MVKINLSRYELEMCKYGVLRTSYAFGRNNEEVDHLLEKFDRILNNRNAR